ncbi:MAG TPA: hypothetical protein PLZ21_04230, partial [Armatimonadota bacterium]|nr:hypothetical protein [Armatimonadota bacterium]
RNGEKRESGQNQQNSSNKSDSPKPVQAADAGSFVTTSFTPGVPAWKSVRIPTPAPDAPAEAAQQADKANGQKPEQKQDEKTETPQVEKPVIRQPAVWQQKTRDDFASGKFEGAAVSTGDDVRMVQAITKLSALPESYVWCVIPDGNGGVFAGTGDNGIVYRIDETGTSSVFCETGEMEVHSLVMDSKGNLYAATSPNGRIYRISGDGQKELVFDAPERYAVTLAADSKDNIYVGVGDSGMVYRISPEGGVIQFAELPNSSVLVLATDKQDNVYAGTGKGGVVFRITPGGLVTPLYNSAEKSIASLGVDSKGNIYAGTGEEKGIIYRISPSGTVKPVFDKAPKALSLTIDTQDSVYVVSDESIYKILPDEKVMSLDTRRAATQFISITIDPNGRIFAGAANSAAVYSSLPMTAGTFESSVYDAGLKSQWSTISWIGNVPEGTSIEVQTRSGNIAKPDSSWSEWSPAYTNAFSQQIVSPAARYIQYRAIMKTTNGFTPVLRQVSITGLTENRVPVVKINEPGQGAAISKSVEIKWTGEDPDKDTLSYDLFYSGDGGNTWLPLDGDFKQVQTETTAPQQQQQTPPQGGVGMEINIEGPNIPDPDEMLAQLTAELEKHPEIPPEIKQQMLEQAPAAIAKAVAEAKAKQQGDKPEQEKQPEQKESTVTTKQTTYKWDTTKVPDGVYMIKVVANDRASNPVGYLTAEDILDPIVVANTAPQLVVMKRQIKVNDDKTATINGYVNNSFIPITGVQYKVDDGDWMGAASVDGIYNSASEYFTIQTKALKAGKHKVEIKAIDAAGNQVSTSVEVEVK